MGKYNKRKNNDCKRIEIVLALKFPNHDNFVLIFWINFNLRK